MPTTSVTVLPKKTRPSQALKEFSIANSPNRTKQLSIDLAKRHQESNNLKNFSIANSPSSSAKDNYVNTLVSNSATPVNRTAPTNDFQSKLSGIQTEAMKVKEMVDQFAERERAGQTTNKTGPSNALKEMSIALSPQSERPDYYAKSRSAMEAYINSLKPTSAEEEASKRISNVRSSISSGMQQASEQAIPMNFITGQQQAIENRGLNMLDPMESELERLIAQRTAESQGLNARQQFETALAGDTMMDDRYSDDVARDERRYAYGVARDESAPIEIDGRLVRKTADGQYEEVYATPPEPPEMPKPFELSEGQSRYEYNPETGKYEMIASKGKTYAPSSGSSATDKSMLLTPEDNRTLLGGGWSETEIKLIQNDIRQFGLPAVIENAKANGATSAQISALQKAYGADTKEETPQFLNKDYFKRLFGDEKLKEAATKAGNVNKGNLLNPFDNSVDTEAYLNQLEQMVMLYREAGYNDKDIIKIMQ